MLHDDEAIVAADGAVRRLSGPLFTEIAEAAMGEKVDEVMLLALTHREEPSAMELVGLGIFNLARYVIKYFRLHSVYVQCKIFAKLTFLLLFKGEPTHRRRHRCRRGGRRGRGHDQ